MRCKHTSEAKVRDLHCTICTKKNVLALDVAVEDLRPVPVEVCQTTRHIYRCLESFAPKEQSLAAVQSRVRITSRQQLIHKCSMLDRVLEGLIPKAALLSRKAEEHDDVWVSASRQEPYLVLEPITNWSFYDFYCNLNTFRQDNMINCAARTMSKPEMFGKAICSTRKLLP